MRHPIFFMPRAVLQMILMLVESEESSVQRRPSNPRPVVFLADWLHDDAQSLERILPYAVWESIGIKWFFMSSAVLLAVQVDRSTGCREAKGTISA